MIGALIKKRITTQAELSLAESGTLYLIEEPVDPVQIRKDTLAMFQLRRTLGHIQIIDNLGSDQNIFLTGDRERLAQRFIDLLKNTLDSHIKNLRKKIGAILPGVKIISSVYGIGYKLNVKLT